MEELEAPDRELMEEALNACDSSYAPYSRFQVGAAVRMANGKIIRGSNQENAAFPVALCAERNALLHAHVLYPGVAVKALAVTAKTAGCQTAMPPPPCGSCRQVMLESQLRSGSPIKIILGGKECVYIFDSVDELLPFGFESIPK